MGRKEPLVDCAIWNVGTEEGSLFPVVTIGTAEDGYRAGYVLPTCSHRHRKWERAADCAVKEGVSLIGRLALGEAVIVPHMADKKSKEGVEG